MEITLKTASCVAIESCLLCRAEIGAKHHKLLSGTLPSQAGVMLETRNEPVFICTGFVWMPQKSSQMVKCAILKSLVSLQSDQPLQLQAIKDGHSVALVTLSDKGAVGQREDTAAPAAASLLEGALKISLLQRYLIPDDAGQLRALVTNLALEQKFDLICTCGGTGVGPRDITPQVTLSLIDAQLPGFSEAMRAASLVKTPNAIISRGVCGVLGSCLIINLPGSRRAVAENLEVVLPALDHALLKLQGDPSDCGG